MRQMYESANDLKNEDDIRQFLEQGLSATLHKLPISYRLDWLVFRNGTPKAVIEFKRRKCKHLQYPDIMLSLGKWNAGLDYVQKNGLAFMFVVQWDDAVGVYMYKPEHPVDIRWGGRTVQTRDSADIEPVVHIPTNQFRIIK